MLTVAATIPWDAPPSWALLQRHLFDALAASIRPYLAKYLTESGILRWGGTGAQHGRDDKDDFYEAFYNWPLLYLLGGDDGLLPLSHERWDAVTRQLAELGLVDREYDLGADFFHQGEGLTYFYLLCMADPGNPLLIDRARRFAEFYTGDDDDAPNFDASTGIIRAPHTGSRGPRPGYVDGDPAPTWPDGMRVYGLPFDDVPGVDGFDDLADPAKARRLGEAMNDRFGRGDVVANLGATALVGNAFLLTGCERYRDWVIAYTAGWRGRAAANGGIVPDNVGEDGNAGRHFGGRWFGGLYGWTWPHGFYNIAQSTAIGGMCAFLLDRKDSHLDLARWQFDAVMDRARVADVRRMTMSLRHHWLPHLGFGSDEALTGHPEPVETLVAPYRHSAAGWFDEQPILPTIPVSLWHMSMAPPDLDRVEALRARDYADWRTVAPGRTKEDAGHEGAWLCFLRGENAGYPDAILSLALATAARRVAQIEADETDLTQVPDHEAHSLVHHWQQLNPVTTEALVQLTLGAPQHLYNGGLLFGRLRYFDADRARPGLPRDVAALVTAIEPERTTVELVNVSLTETRRVILQAGTFAEHRFGAARYRRRTGDYPGAVGGYVAPGSRAEAVETPVDATHLCVTLPPAHAIILDLDMRLNTEPPTYRHPAMAAIMRRGAAAA